MVYEILNFLFAYTLTLMGMFILTGIAVGLETALLEATGHSFATLPSAVMGEFLYQYHRFSVWFGMTREELLAPRVVTPRYFDELPSPAAPATPAADINTCSKEELLSIPGIGDAVADRIIAGRPYADISDVARVKGIGAKKLAALTSWAAR